MKAIPSPFDASALLLSRAGELLAARRLPAALHAFACAQQHGADMGQCAAGRWLAHALSGDYGAAWQESADIRARSLGDANCLWRGEDITGKRVIVRCLHGFGDAVQFFRYAPKLNARAARVVWELPPALVEIARRFRGVERVLPWESCHPWAREWDVQLEIIELPCIFETQLDALPIAEKYLQLPREAISRVRGRMGVKTAPRVGLVWAAGEWNPSRSIAFHALRRLLQTNGCEFWSLQGGAARQAANCDRMRDSTVCGDGLLPLAALIAQLDLVITVDTLAAHLAGALGVPAWVMLQHAADWRWMTERADSPWYPSLRLFRQRQPGDWASVLRNVEESLRAWIGPYRERLAA